MSRSNACYEFQNKGSCYRKNCRFDHVHASARDVNVHASARETINQPKKEAHHPNPRSYFTAAQSSSISQGARAYPVETFANSPKPAPRQNGNFSNSPTPRHNDETRYNQSQSRDTPGTHFRDLPSSNQASKPNSRSNPPEDGINRKMVLVSSNYNKKPLVEEYPETRKILYNDAVPFNPTVPPPVPSSGDNPILKRAKKELNKLDKSLEDRSQWMNDPKNTPKDCIQILQDKMNRRQKLIDWIRSVENSDVTESSKYSSRETAKDTGKISHRVSNYHEETVRRSRSNSRDEEIDRRIKQEKIRRSHSRSKSVDDSGEDRKSRKRRRSSSDYTDDSRRRRGSGYGIKDEHSPSRGKLKSKKPLNIKEESPKRRRRSRFDSRSEKNKNHWNINEETSERRHRSGSENRSDGSKSRPDRNVSNIKEESPKRRRRSGSENAIENNKSQRSRRKSGSETRGDRQTLYDNAEGSKRRYRSGSDRKNVKDESPERRRRIDSESRSGRNSAGFDRQHSKEERPKSRNDGRDSSASRFDRDKYSKVKRESQSRHKTESEMRREGSEIRCDKRDVKEERPRRRRESQSVPRYESNERRIRRNSNHEVDESSGHDKSRHKRDQNPFQQNFSMSLKQERMKMKENRDSKAPGPGKKNGGIWIMPKHGDPWECEACGRNTVAWRPKCFHCEEPMPGNWKCPKEKCGVINWKKSMSCEGCFEVNPVVWVCQAEGCGEYNWNNKKVCYGCHRSEGRPLLDDKGDRGVNRRSRELNKECKPFGDQERFKERGSRVENELNTSIYKTNQERDRYSFDKTNNASGSRSLDSEKIGNDDDRGDKDSSYDWGRHFEEQKEKNRKQKEIEKNKLLETNKRLAMLAGNYLTAEGDPVVSREGESGEDEIEWLDDIGPIGNCDKGPMESCDKNSELAGPSGCGVGSNSGSRNKPRAVSPKSPWEKVNSPRRGTRTRDEICIDVTDSEDDANEDPDGVSEREELVLSEMQKKTSALSEELRFAEGKRRDQILKEMGVTEKKDSEVMASPSRRVRERDSEMTSSPSKRVRATDSEVSASPSKRGVDALKSPFKRVHVIAGSSTGDGVQNVPTRSSEIGSYLSERASDVITSQGSPVCIDLDEDQEQLSPASPEPNIVRRNGSAVDENAKGEKLNASAMDENANGEKGNSSAIDETHKGEKTKESIESRQQGHKSVEPSSSGCKESLSEEKSKGEKPKESSEELAGEKSRQSPEASPPDPLPGQKKKLKLADYKLRKKASEDASSSKSNQEKSRAQENSNSGAPPDDNHAIDDDDILVIHCKEKF